MTSIVDVIRGRLFHSITALIHGSIFSYEGALIHGRLLFMAVYGMWINMLILNNFRFLDRIT